MGEWLLEVSLREQPLDLHQSDVYLPPDAALGTARYVRVRNRDTARHALCTPVLDPAVRPGQV